MDVEHLTYTSTTSPWLYKCCFIQWKETWCRTGPKSNLHVHVKESYRLDFVWVYNFVCEQTIFVQIIKHYQWDFAYWHMLYLSNIHEQTCGCSSLRISAGLQSALRCPRLQLDSQPAATVCVTSGPLYIHMKSSPYESTAPEETLGAGEQLPSEGLQESPKRKHQQHEDSNLNMRSLEWSAARGESETGREESREGINEWAIRAAEEVKGSTSHWERRLKCFWSWRSWFTWKGGRELKA